MKKLKVLVACEESQTVTIAFRNLGHEAFSCDLQECSGGHPEWHIHGDAVKEAYSGNYDMMIAHPPCTYMSNAGARWMYPSSGVLCQDRYLKAIEAKKFFLQLLNAPIKYIAVENPTPLKVVGLPKQNQVIQPYEYGHEFSKRTLLWLKNLPLLNPTNVKSSYTSFLPSNTGGKKRGHKYKFVNITQKDSSKTFKGIAEAMAKQWSDYVIKKNS